MRGLLQSTHHRAGVTQLVESLLPKQVVVGSSPIARSTRQSRFINVQLDGKVAGICHVPRRHLVRKACAGRVILARLSH